MCCNLMELPSDTSAEKQSFFMQIHNLRSKIYLRKPYNKKCALTFSN
jgi:hypothetical protein